MPAPCRAVARLLATIGCCLVVAVLLAPVLSAAELAASSESARAGESADRGDFSHGSWPFCPPQRPEPPSVNDESWIENPIDRFVLSDLERMDLRPSPRADRLTLLRRVTFDLTGLPPTREEQEDFLADESPDAYRKVVDRLLDSPHYGERWAQHWLDLVRYAETDGFNADGHRPMAHKYRDYVIRALNDDRPYDQFIAQQLAGDELEPDNPEALIATGLNRLYPDEYNAADLRLRRQEILDDITDTTGLVFMGLTMGCAQCHDHKFDEILQADYFRLQSFFQPMLPRDDMVVATPEERAAYDQQYARWNEATREIREQIDAIIQPRLEKIAIGRAEKYDEEIRQAIVTPEPERNAYQRQIYYQATHYLYRPQDITTAIAGLKNEALDQYNALTEKLKQFDHLKPEPLPTAMGITDAGPVAPPTFMLATGNVRKPMGKVEPGFPEFLGNLTPNIVPPEQRPDSTGRRTALVRWLTRSDHPLTSRVMVNRIWQHHFGEGIVPSSNDFGAMGDAPSHPDLLDWLSVEFVESGWSFKHLHRLMVTSATYCQTSVVDPHDANVIKAREKDLANRKLWRANRQRLQGEALRDAALAVSGELNRRMYGPSAKPALPPDISSAAWKPDAKQADQNRRSVYVLAKRNLRYPLFDAFDQPDMHHSCGHRATTTTAPQALLMLNSEFTLDRARHWAGRQLAETSADLPRLVREAYRTAYGRVAAEDEVATALEFIDAQAERLAAAGPKANLHEPQPQAAQLPAPVAAAVVDFFHALLNSNEFIYVD